VIEKMLPYLLQDGAARTACGMPSGGMPDAVIWQTADGRKQVTFGWYGTSCLPGLRQKLAAGNYKVRDALEDLRVIWLAAEEHGLPAERFRNLNTPEDMDSK